MSALIDDEQWEEDTTALLCPMNTMETTDRAQQMHEPCTALGIVASSPG